MNLRTAISLSKGGRLRLLWHVTKLFTPFYRVSFVASAARAGVLRLLAGGARPLGEIAAEIAPDPAAQASLEAWLDLGVCLGDLDRDASGYSLKSPLARRLAQPANDDVAALLEEVATFHHRLILETPRRWKSRDPWSPLEHDGVLLARSSRILEQFVFHSLDSVLPESGPVRLLDVGCGAGTYLRRAAERNPQLEAVGIEARPAVAEEARRAIAEAGLEGRVRVETGDIRDRAPGERFDVVTLFNAIYYFPREERVALLEKIAAHLAPGGLLVLSTSCRGGSAGMQVLDLWASSTRGLGPLPTEAEIVTQVRRAGFLDPRPRRAIPGEAYITLVATNGFPSLPAR